MNCAEKLLEPTIFFNLYTKSLRDIDLKIIVKFLKKTSKLKTNESDSKESKLTKLSHYLKIEQEQVLKPVQTKKIKM